MAPGSRGGRVDRIKVHDAKLEVLRVGSGPPLLVLHGMQPISPDAPFLAPLTKRFEVIAPSHPGFGGSSRPDGFETVYDLLRLYLSLLDKLDLPDLTLMGFSFGGWIAAELAVVGSDRLTNLVLVDALGIKVSDRETPDILDVFNTHPDIVQHKTWHDPARAPDLDAMTDEQLTARAQNWNTLCLYGWDPYMHTPQLARWLGRIAVPTLAVWGESDGIVAPSYGRAYAERIPGAEFASIPRAGHHPELEQPEAFAACVLRFLDKTHKG